ncbi:MAG TPA: hydrogen gas-evolving membrane-bound hydrogenase subunit E [Oscillospiraceae bacterium]|nr:hydrogen gas-evolving membrane-bound hydrogenase subunit E [Oscillospiraceae bacterium]
MKKIKTVLIILLCMVSFFGVLNLLSNLPDFGKADNPIHNQVYKRYTENSMEDTGIPNMVTSIVLDYRAYDTMFETIVLFTATIAVLVTLKSSRKDQLNAESNSEKKEQE